MLRRVSSKLIKSSNNTQKLDFEITNKINGKNIFDEYESYKERILRWLRQRLGKEHFPAYV